MTKKMGEQVMMRDEKTMSRQPANPSSIGMG